MYIPLREVDIDWNMNNKIIIKWILWQNVQTLFQKGDRKQIVYMAVEYFCIYLLWWRSHIPLEILTLHIIVSYVFDDLFLRFAAISVRVSKSKSKFVLIDSSFVSFPRWNVKMMIFTWTNCLWIVHGFCVWANSVRRCNGKIHDFPRIFSKSFYIHCGLRRKIQRCLCSSPVEQWKENIKIVHSPGKSIWKFHSHNPPDAIWPKIACVWMIISVFLPMKMYWFVWCLGIRQCPCVPQPNSMQHPQCPLPHAFSCRTTRNGVRFLANSNRPRPAFDLCKFDGQDEILFVPLVVGNYIELDISDIRLIDVHMLFVIVHDFPLHRCILVGHKTIRRQVGVVRIVLGRIITAGCCTWNRVETKDTF